MPDECTEPDSEFYPDLLTIPVATLDVNYMEHSFNQSISEKKPFK